MGRTDESKEIQGAEGTGETIGSSTGSTMTEHDTATETETMVDELSGWDVEGALTDAQRTGALVELSRLSGGAPMPCVFARLTRETVVIQSRNPAELDGDDSPGCRFNVAVSSPRGPLRFMSELVSCDETEAGVRLVLRRPACVSILQRRRFQRTRTRRSSSVHIGAADGEGTSEAAMLNVSPEGLACRVERLAVDALGTDEAVRLRFSLDGDDHVYDVPGVLKSRTPASDADQVILRLQFETVAMSEDDRNRLRDATAHPQV